MNVSLRLAAALVLAAVIFGSPALADEKPDQDAIVHLMKATFDKPDSPLAVDPVSVEADYAVAGWTQNGMGGRALLRKKEGEWRLVLCSGASLKSAEALLKIGLPTEIADSLAGEVAAAEAPLDPQRIARLDSFDGTVVMDEEGNGPAGHDKH